jgi:hypothetical protein
MRLFSGFRGKPPYADKKCKLAGACQAGDFDEVQRLVNLGIDVDDRQNLCTLPPLVYASSKGYLDIAEFLVQKGADVDFNKPLHWACMKGNLDIAMLLLRNGATIDMFDTLGFTALHHACRCDRFDCVVALLDNGANISKTSRITGSTCLHLLAEGDYDYAHERRNSSYHQAGKRVETARLLVSRGVDVFAKNTKGQTAMDVAMETYNKIPNNAKLQVVNYLGSLMGVSKYDTLNVGVAKRGANTEFINAAIMPMEADERVGKRFFYNVRNVDPDTNIARMVFEENVLKTPLDKNPFTTRPWSGDYKTLLKQLPQDGGGIEHKVYKGKKYRVRAGPKGGKYIVVKNEKKYIRLK